MTRAIIGMALLAALPAFHFVERGSDAGLQQPVECGGTGKKWIMEANGTGVAVLDYDQDGWMDLLVVNGSSVERLTPILKTGSAPARANGVFLYRNIGAGRFRDVTDSSGLLNPYWGTGANVADVDGDGYPDILITTIGRDLLFHNERNGTFSEVSTKSGLHQTIAWHTGSAFGDYDGDGDLDLYIAGYVDVHSLGVGGRIPLCDYLHLSVFCGPMNLKGEPDVFYRNRGDGTFEDATRAAGLLETVPRYGFTVVFEDFNGDGKPDIMVANDSAANYLYLNDGRGAFGEAALTSGVALNASGKSQANMGIAVGDIDNDGDLDVLTTTFSEDYFPLFEQVHPGIYEEVSGRAGLVAPTTPLLGWACGLVDMDNDGWRDLWLANGHVYPEIAKAARSSYEQQVVILRNQRGRFASPEPLPATRRESWRGGAYADFNNDGKIDIVVTPIAGTPALFENHAGAENHWIGIDTGRHLRGARITVEGCGKRWFDTTRNGGSYLSADDPRRHFGLGTCASVDQVRVRWAGGPEQVLARPAVDRYHKLP